ncbi:3-deoxy-manno-octulosonate cytidylyltransferase [Limimaricola sp. AA108-03]|uniref:3-deoxy-manno-octulosonate cytidylyltransferase n=1 Tax=Limimaricola sp. AA108-03 TaxID=3425945 RepID=UPI003D78436B
MKTVVVIPARYASTRYPGKPLAALSQPDGSRKSLIQMSWEAACQVGGVDAVYVATDDERIREAAEGFGADVLMTPENCRNGTERCAAALNVLSESPDLVVNFQGDAPLTPSWFVEDLIAVMGSDGDAQVATPVLRCDETTLAHFLEDRAAGRVGGTTAVFDRNQRAMYFSKEVLPYLSPSARCQSGLPVYHHVGVYAYRPTALRAYAEWPEGEIERLEGLEQLRFLENGCPVRCVTVEARNRVFWELNNPEDVARIETVLKDS